MNAALWGIASALTWGGADFIARFTGRKLGPDVAPVIVSVDCKSAGVKKKRLFCPAMPLKLSTPGVSVNVAMRYLTRNG